MMRTLLVLLIFLPTEHLFAADKTAPSTTGSCRMKVENLIRTTARTMGVTQKFDFQLTTADGGRDISDRPLTIYNSSLLRVDDGYITNSGAIVTVRPTPTSCEIIKITLSVGA